MTLKLFNTLSRKKEIFKPIDPPKVGIYICGPTVYEYSHIGHMRTYVNSDVLVRTLRYLGFKPYVVMNITDVGHLTGDRDMGEDKMEKSAREKKKDIWEVAKFYTDYFWVSMASVNVQKPDVVCKATDYIKEMVSLISILEQKGFTYKTSDGIYFDTSKFKNYGQLAKLDIKGLKEGARVERNQEKKNLTDFALWKFSPKEGVKRQMEWDSPWGIGFPGWHIECSAMSMNHLGQTFDLHTGGVDHIPVHHTNEIAQSQAATGKPFVKYWFHSEALLVEGEKMSKSLGNFYTLDDVKKRGSEPLALRYLFLTSHYRKKLNYSWKSLEAAQETLRKLFELMATFCKPAEASVGLSDQNLKKVDLFRSQFKLAIEDDLNTSQALALVWQVAKSNLPSTDKADLLLLFDEVLGLGLDKASSISSPQPMALNQIKNKKLKALLQEREELRKNKQWQKADEVKKNIEASGWMVRDTPEGTTVLKK